MRSKAPLAGAKVKALAHATVLLASSWVQAANAPEKDLALDVTAPPECPRRESLARGIEARSDVLRVGLGDAPNRVQVAVQSAERYSATVVVSEPSGTKERRLEGADCSELMEAVALIIVVTLDPTGQLLDEPAPEATTETATPDAAAGAQRADTGSSETTAPTPAQTPEWRDDFEPPELAGPIDFSKLVPDRFGFGAAARAHLGPAPTTMLGPEASFEVLWNPEQIVAPRLALAVSRAWSGPVIRAQGRAEFTLDQILLELCPIRFGQVSWDVRPCLQGAGGRMIAAGSNAAQARTRTRPWGAFGAAVRASARPLRWLEGWLSVGVGAATVRDKYQFEPVVFHAVPQEIISGALGVSLLFP